MTIEFAHIIDAAHIRVGDLARNADLAYESLETGGIAFQVGGKKLEGDRLPDLEVIGTVDLSHSATAHERDDAIPAVHDRSGNKGRAVAVGYLGEVLGFR